MTIFKKLKFWLIALPVIATTATLAFALSNTSNYTPVRQGIPYVSEGTKGLPYPSFNSFTNNPNILEGARKGDERTFLLGSYCQSGACPKDEAHGGSIYNYENTPYITENGQKKAIAFEKGDRVQFEVYFHNNGDDPTNGDSYTSENATNVKIGVNLDGIDPADPYILRPVGFISATNNEYHEDPYDKTSKKINGNEATDDMQLFRYSKDLTLKPVEGTVYLRLKLNGKPVGENPTYFRDYISTTSQTSINFTDFKDPAIKTVTVKTQAYIDTAKNQMYIYLDHLPGCFRFSGFAYFEAEVTGPKEEVPPEINLCQSLSLTETSVDTCKSPSEKRTYFNATVKLEKNSPIQDKQYVTFVTDDKNANLYTSINNTANYIESTYKYISPKKIFTPIELTNNNPTSSEFVTHGWYIGIGNLTAYYSDKNGTPVNGVISSDGVLINIQATTDNDASQTCRATIPTCDNICKSISVDAPSKIEEGTWSVMRAYDSADYYGNDFTDKVNYTAANMNGEFYKTLADLLAVHPEAIENPYNPSNLSYQPAMNMAFFMPNLMGSQNNNPFQANIFMPSSPIQTLNLNSWDYLEVPLQTNLGLYNSAVFFYAKKAGTDVIKIQAANTDTAGCTKYLSIEPKITGPTCGAVNIEATPYNKSYNTSLYPNSTCLGPKDDMIKISLLQAMSQDGNKIFTPGVDTIEVKWTASNGTFFETDGTQTGNPIVSTNAVVLFRNGNSAITADVYGVVTKINGISVGDQCQWHYKIEKCPVGCKNLDVNFTDGTSTMKVGETKTVNIKVTSNFNEDLYTHVKWKDNSKSTFTFPPNTLVYSFQNEYESKYPEAKTAVMEKPTLPGTVTANVLGYESVCYDTLTVLPIEEQKPYCRNLELTFDDGTKEMPVGYTKSFTVKATSNTGADYPAKIRWTHDALGNMSFGEIGMPINVILDYPLYSKGLYTKPTKEGQIKAEVVGEESLCTDYLWIKGVAVCQVLDVEVSGTNGFAAVNPGSITISKEEIAEGVNYTMNSEVVYTGPKDNIVVTYSTLEQYGCFTKLTWQQPTPNWPLTLLPERDASGNIICKPIAENIPEESLIVFTPNPNLQKGTYANAITIKESDPTCVRKIALVITEQDIPMICKTLDITVGTVKNPIAFSYNVADISQHTELIVPDLQYSKANPTATINYSAVKNGKVYGKFLKGIKIPVIGLNMIWVPDISDTWTTTKLNVPATQAVFFKPETTLATGNYLDVIEITAANSNKQTEPLCTKYLDILVSETQVACTSITLGTNPADFKGGTGTKVWVDPASALNDYRGRFVFTISTTDGQGKLQVKNTAGAVVSESTAVVVDFATATNTIASGTQAGVYLTNSTPDPDETVTVSVRAIDKGGEPCIRQIEYTVPSTNEEACDSLKIVVPAQGDWEPNSNQTFRVEVDGDNVGNYHYIWETTSGNGHFAEDRTYGNSGQINTFHDAEDGTKATVYVEEYSYCRDSVTAEEEDDNDNDHPHDNKGNSTINKYVYAIGSNGNVKSDSSKKIININNSTNVKFKIVYNPDSDVQSVEIKDPSLSGGKIKGSRDGHLVYADKSLEITARGDELDTCTFKNGKPQGNDPCIDADTYSDYQSAFINSKTVSITNLDDDTITITYEMRNDSSIDTESCKTMSSKNGCGEEFANRTSFKDYEDLDFSNDFDTGSDEATVIVVCPYILTRTGGDTFFESDLETGVDVSYCGPQKNIQGHIIIPTLPIYQSASSGTKTTPQEFLTSQSHNVCKYSGVPDKTGIEAYNNPLTHFSSAICEMKAEVAESWQKANVISQIENNIDKISIWSSGNNPPTITSLASLKTDSSGIFKWTGTDVTIGNGSGKFEITESVNGIPAGQTYIVLNGDLRITSDIIYGTMNPGKEGLVDPETVPSAAFIVINGDIIVDKNVEELWGTYIAIDTDTGDDRGGSNTGKIIAGGGRSDNQLTIYGSLIGDVTDLFGNRVYVGDIASDKGSVTIKYIENIFLNTPPGLSDLMDVTSLKVAK